LSSPPHMILQVSRFLLCQSGPIIAEGLLHLPQIQYLLKNLQFQPTMTSSFPGVPMGLCRFHRDSLHRTESQISLMLARRSLNLPNLFSNPFPAIQPALHCAESHPLNPIPVQCWCRTYSLLLPQTRYSLLPSQTTSSLHLMTLHRLPS
jgi:hypothetical protein